MSRLFVAVRPPAELRVQLGAIDRPELAGVRWVAPQQWHVTLVFLGRAEEAAVVSALGSVRLPRCEAALGPAVEMLTSSVIVVPVSGLEQLATAVRAATESLGGASSDRPFRGHLTLARLKNRRSGAGGAGQLGSTGEPGSGVRSGGALPLGVAVSGRWEPAMVELISSVTGPRGVLHETVATFPVG